MAQEIVVLETLPTEFTGLDGQKYFRAADGTLLRPGEFAFQPELISGVLGIVTAAAGGETSENS